MAMGTFHHLRRKGEGSESEGHYRFRPMKSRMFKAPIGVSCPETAKFQPQQTNAVGASNLTIKRSSSRRGLPLGFFTGILLRRSAPSSPVLALRSARRQFISTP